ncbi:MAG TPA: hypothetical protein VER09_08975, partial [Pseudomonas sp.]|nr:hypothetical protein [Pseudomonas sp.]
MTIRTLTSNPAELPGAEAPAGLPDVAALAQLANQFFASLPGEAFARPAPASELTLGDGAPSLAAAEPRATATSPAGTRADGQPLPPEAYAAAIPQVAPSVVGSAPAAGGAPAGAPGYYFASDARQPTAATAERAPRIEAQPFALPGADALERLLVDIVRQPAVPVHTQAAAPAAGQFYFLDGPGNAVPRLEARRDP